MSIFPLMKRPPTLEDHIKFHMDRAFTGYSEPMDIASIKKRFEGFPNEACYLLDCQTLQTHLVYDNFAEVLGIPNFHPETVADVVHQIHEEHLPLSMSFSAAVLANETLVECGKDNVSQVFRLHNDRMILKTSTPLQMDSNRHVILVVEQLKDVTNLVNQAFTWSCSGPNADKLESLIRNSLQKNLPLTPQQITVLSLIGKGYSSKQAADVLLISKHTVDTHRRNILKKLDANNTNEALKQMIDLGVLTWSG